MFAATAEEREPRRDTLRATRIALGLSQSALARVANVPRWKINSYELGDDSLSAEDFVRIDSAFRAVAQRLRALVEVL
jgi:predicted transcriptional regulator